jgi:flagellar biosynthesis/type III secretory pathway protein FliH
MPYISTFEQMAMKKGMEEGKQQGIQEGRQEGMQQEVLRLLVQILNIKFKEISESIIKQLENINDKYVLELLHSHAILCNSIEDFEKKMNDIVSKKN